MQSKHILKLGQIAQIRKAFDLNEVVEYTKSSVDTNPIHCNEEYAKETIFGKRIVPGLQVASLFGGLLGTELPGRGTILLGQTLSFKKPVYINDEVLAIIEIIKIRFDKPIITFKTTCFNSKNELAVDGQAVVKVI